MNEDLTYECLTATIICGHRRLPFHLALVTRQPLLSLSLLLNSLLVYDFLEHQINSCFKLLIMVRDDCHPRFGF